MRSWPILIAATLAILLGGAQARAEARFAAVIGVEAYGEGFERAPGANADAVAVGAALAQAGYVVEVYRDASQGDLRRATYWLGEHLQAAGEDAVGLFYFAGHVAQTEGVTFLLGRDARAGGALAIAQTGVAASFVVAELNAAGNAPNIVVLDISSPGAAVHNLGLGRGSGSFDTPKDGVILLSDQPGDAPPPRAPGLSAFARAFIELIGSPAVEFDRGVAALRRSVDEETDGLRRVWTAGRPDNAGFRLVDPDADEREALDITAEREVIRLADEGEEDADAVVTRFHEVTVFFATDRALDGSVDAVSFRSESDGQITYGVARVLVPPGLSRGDLEAPEWWTYESLADVEPAFSLRGLETREQDRFFEQIRGAAQASGAREAFVFVHGFDTGVEDALVRAARLHHELGFDGAPIAFLWPSLGENSALAYDRDAVAADRAAPRLERFLEFVAERTGAERVHVIAHGLGARAAMRALAGVASRRPTSAFDQVVLVAPDIELEAFDSMAGDVAAAAARVTVYASHQDPALESSRRWIETGPRAGEFARSEPDLAPGVDLIDASDVRTDLFSADAGPSASIVEDLGDLLATRSGPAERRRAILVEQVTESGRGYWAIAPWPEAP